MSQLACSKAVCSWAVQLPLINNIFANVPFSNLSHSCHSFHNNNYYFLNTWNIFLYHSDGNYVFIVFNNSTFWDENTLQSVALVFNVLWLTYICQCCFQQLSHSCQFFHNNISFFLHTQNIFIITAIFEMITLQFPPLNHNFHFVEINFVINSQFITGNYLFSVLSNF